MREITGRHVLIFTVMAFGIIIGVNLLLAVQAVRTFPGLEVKNTYVASQTFDADRAAQLALDWEVSADYSDGLLAVSVTKAGQPAPDVADLTALVGWATSTHDDVVPDFSRNNATFTAPLDLVPGNWNIRLKATASDGTEFKQRVILHVKASSAG
ncbi:FixH family protein [Fluviibacterium sp. S390]|uniref:FixH family protein n=1 Tax=Fluviibacterium sp. S390 TaxID=3415139 RepID=UPI003C7CBB94